MLIDINASIGHWPFKQVKYNTCKTLLERMDHFGTEISIISNLNGIFYKNTQSSNEELFDELKSNKKYAGRFLPFCIINPIYAGWKDDLKICRDQFGMKGIRLYPLYHDYEMKDAALVELLKIARDSAMIVAFSLRIVDSRQRSWMDISKEWTLKDIIPVIREVPDGKYMILNIANNMRLSEEEKELLKRTNLLMDTSGREISNLGELIVTYGKDKFAFGTHSPILDYASSLLRIETLRKSETSDEERELIRSGNAKRLLGLS